MVDAVPASQVLPVNQRLCSFSPGCLARLLVAITEDGAIRGPEVRAISLPLPVSFTMQTLVVVTC